MADTCRPDFETSDHRLTVEVASGLHLYGDRRLFAQALSNMLENVLRHTPSGTTAFLSAGQLNEVVEITLKDDGPGVSPLDADRLFQRFARAEASRSTTGNAVQVNGRANLPSMAC